MDVWARWLMGSMEALVWQLPWAPHLSWYRDYVLPALAPGLTWLGTLDPQLVFSVLIKHMLTPGFAFKIKIQYNISNRLLLVLSSFEVWSSRIFTTWEEISKSWHSVYWAELFKTNMKERMLWIIALACTRLPKFSTPKQIFA